MRSISWKEFLELGGIVAILVGLVFVYAELKQNGTIARAQLSATSAEITIGLFETIRDKEFATVLSKSIESPEELTRAERLQMNAFLDSAIYRYYRERYYYSLGLFATWDDTIGPSAPRTFGTEYGRAYWNAVKAFHNPELVEAVDNALANNDYIDNLNKIDSDVMRQLQQD